MRLNSRALRARLVEAGDAERRRLERDLHDGAQSRLVALALLLRTARTHAGADEQLAGIARQPARAGNAVARRDPVRPARLMPVPGRRGCTGAGVDPRRLGPAEPRREGEASLPPSPVPGKSWA
jgi:hypothetical protein